MINSEIRKTVAFFLVLLMAFSVSGLPAYAEWSQTALWPERTDEVFTDSAAGFDIGNRNNGYIYVWKTVPEEGEYKILVKHESSEENIGVLDYDGSGEPVIIPLTEGSGSYEIGLYKKVWGKEYAAKGSCTIYADIPDFTDAFLYPNRYVDYNEDSPFLEDAEQFCSGKSEPEAFERFRAYFEKCYTYDFVTSIARMSPDYGLNPRIDRTFELHMGICQDLASLAVAMLRSRGIRAAMDIGRANGKSHAWVSVWIDGKEITWDPSGEITKSMTGPIYYDVKYRY